MKVYADMQYCAIIYIWAEMEYTLSASYAALLG